MTRHVFIIALTAISSLPANANWPAWRGANGDGISPETNLPLRWSTNENVRWRIALPEPGNSTPVIWANRIFVTQAVTAGNQRTLMCFDRADGRLLWQSGIVVDAAERTYDGTYAGKYNRNPYASASPVTDGGRVVCWFGSGGVVAYDFEGKELWKTDLGRHDHQFGYGGSPVIHGDRVFLNFGPGASEFLVALDKNTGKELWRHTSPEPAKADINGSWSTPFIAEWNGETQVVSALRGEFAGLDPATGRLLWHTPIIGPSSKASPFGAEGIVIVTGSLTGAAEVAVRLGGSGDVTESHVVWHHKPAKPRVPTGVVRDGLVYCVTSSGIADCQRLATGEFLWEERLLPPGTASDVWSSLMLAGDRLYVLSQSGNTYVFRAAPEFELLAVNAIGERSNSSVAASKGDLFLRTHEALWCIGGN